MKILRITESQYKRLVRKKNLNEQNKIVYKDIKDENDVVSQELKNYLYTMADAISYNFDKDLYIDKIEEGVVHINWDKYSEDEKRKIIELVDLYVELTGFSEDKHEEGDYYSGSDLESSDLSSHEHEYDPEDWPGHGTNQDVVTIDEPDVDDTTSSDIRQKIVDKAAEQIGDPYVYGGEEFCGKGGDCSGLIDWTLNNVSGIDSPYNGRESTNALRKLVTSNNLNRKTGLDKGDILIFKPKCGEFGSKYECIDASTGEKTMCECKVGHTGFVYDVSDGKVDMIDSASGSGVRILKDVFNTDLAKKRYYGVIPIVDGKYESK